jgi:hypothetical protein
LFSILLDEDASVVELRRLVGGRWEWGLKVEMSVIPMRGRIGVATVGEVEGVETK